MNENTPNPVPIKLLVVDDHQIVITGIKYLLKNSFPKAIVDGALTTEILEKKLKATQYDLIILDINMPGADTHSLIHFTKNIQTTAKILIYSMNSEEMFAKRYLQLGANGYLMKDAGEEHIIAAINKLLSGGRYLSPKILEQLSEDAFKGRSANLFDNLTPREFEILKHLVKGLGIKEIAALTNLHHSTISTHKAKILEKTATHNILELKEIVDMHNLF